ncbi:hypothetical protein BGY98DRAFT_1104516 [Russula aff. rugulosa BPL654]|nr:hypothetical protein BGY98DRAFT_1104516 [Russula aff. rugulosa BPL654]
MLLAKTAVVSSAAAATCTSWSLLGPADRDAFSIFEDLCLLDNGLTESIRNSHNSSTFTRRCSRADREYITHELPPTNSSASIRGLTLITTSPLPPAHQNTLRALRLLPPLRDTHDVFLLLNQFSSQLETEAEFIPTVLTKLINREADAGELGPGWMWRCRIRVQYLAALRCLGPLATDGWTSGSSSARVFTSLTSALKLLVTLRPTLLGVSAQMPGVGVPASDSRSHLHSHHSSDSVAEMLTMTTSGTGTIGTGAGLSVKNAAIKVQCIDELNKADAPPIPETSIHLLSVQGLTSFFNGLTGYTILLQHPRSPKKPHAG